MPRALTNCPNCGQRVTPYAAGCAVCGTDLEAARARRRARPGIELPRVGWSGGSSGSIDWVHVALALVASLALAPLGFILGIYWATRYNREGNTAMVLFMLVAVALAVAAMVAPVWFWSHILHI